MDIYFYVCMYFLKEINIEYMNKCLCIYMNRQVQLYIFMYICINMNKNIYIYGGKIEKCKYGEIIVTK